MARMRSRRQCVSGVGLDGFGFEQIDGLEFRNELRAGSPVGVHIVLGQNHGLAGETVAQSVERSAALPSELTGPVEWAAFCRLIAARVAAEE